MGGTTYYLNDGGLAYEKEFKANGITEEKHYLSLGGITFALVTKRSGAGVTVGATGALAPSQVRYFHSDHLGSISVITDEQGAVDGLRAQARCTSARGAERRRTGR